MNIERKISMKRLILLAFLVAGGLGWWLAQPAVAQGKSTAHTDQTFVQQAASGGMAEVQMGKLAAERAASPEVKQFGQRMVGDHTQANNDLLALAQAQKISVPTALDQHHKTMADKLAALHGPEFDQAYMAGQVADHEKAVTLFTKEANEGQIPELKAFAAKTLPTLQTHWRMAKELTGKQQGERAQR
jgi:putative membrane protein